MPDGRASDRSSVIAALGPTNTGKTHRAIERMLEHETGMIGLPLRLLAREVYDRVSSRVGEAAVALMTGEEKRVPKHARYWVCTVEAMPTDIEVECLAIDEIQLAQHRERGHVFTDRLLRARGSAETWFLGSDTMRPLLEELVPTARFEHLRRYSSLRYAKKRSLRSLPPRSAVVAFSIEQVYQVADTLRQLRGGVAVVTGALSPRTRNAQVAMYQAGEVQYLVATDCIGMGLNLDIDHVVFAGLRKYDGREHRVLRADELAQVAGRAGRHLNDGTFATLSTAPELEPRLAHDIEAHRFAPARTLVWRNAELDFSTMDALLHSLSRPPRHRALRRVERADDHESLLVLAGLPEVRALTQDAEAVACLWEVCQIPDYRKLLLNQHAGLLLDIYRQLRSRGRLDTDWLAREIARVDDDRGSIETLTSRLQAVRTWTYVSHRAAWLDHGRQVQERTRAVEDALGDALHQRLIERFVERSVRPRPVRFRPRGQEGKTVNGPFAGLASPEETEEGFVERVVQANHTSFELDRRGRIVFEGRLLARLLRGKEMISPAVAIDEPEMFTAGSRARVQRRLVALARDWVAEAMGGLPATSALQETAEARALLYRLQQGLGIVPRAAMGDAWTALSKREREAFARHGLKEGQRYYYVAGALTPEALQRRVVIVSLWLASEPPKGAPDAAWIELAHMAEPADAWLFGYEPIAARALRVDVLEWLVAALQERPNDALVRLDDLGLTGDESGQLLRGLGYRVIQCEGALRVEKARRRRRGGHRARR